MPVSRETARATQPGDVTPTNTAANRTGPADQTQTEDNAGRVLSNEHTLGNDPARTAGKEFGWHDSVSGRAVSEEGVFLDGTGEDDRVPPHRIVANNWPEVREADEPQANPADEPTPNHVPDASAK